MKDRRACDKYAATTEPTYHRCYPACFGQMLDCAATLFLAGIGDYTANSRGLFVGVCRLSAVEDYSVTHEIVRCDILIVQVAGRICRLGMPIQPRPAL